MRQLLTLTALITLWSAGPLRAGGAAPVFSDRQEAVLLEANRVTTAAERCDFRIDRQSLSALLTAAGIGERDMVVRALSVPLRMRVNDDIRSYRGHKEQRCADALARFGKRDSEGRALLSK